jgi:uncharacterized protein (DUF983 family)
MAEKSKIGLGVRRGLRLRCPECGEGRLFTRFLKVSNHCEVCGSDNTIYPSDDAPPYIAILIVGHVIVPLMLWADSDLSMPLWLMFSIWLPLTAAVTIAALPFAKGLVVGFAWATGVTREGTVPPAAQPAIRAPG